jgi:hypothetical protein
MSEHKIPKTKLVQPTKEYDELQREVMNVIKKYSDNMDAIEILAILSYTVGQCCAMQNQYKYNSDMLMRIISQNIELGNQHAIDSIFENTKGNA